MSATSQAVADTFGAILLGQSIAAVLWGVSILQTYQYFTDYSHDNFWLKGSVVLLQLLEPFDQIMLTEVTYWYLVSCFGRPEKLGFLTWRVKALVFAAFIGMIVQSFFAYRVWILSQKNNWLLGFIASLIIGTLTSGLVFLVKLFGCNLWVEVSGLNPVLVIYFSFEVATDVFISGCMIYLLQKSRSGFVKTGALINRLITYSLTTCLQTSTFAVLAIVLLNAIPRKFWYLSIYITLNRLYAITLLATLNGRTRLNQTTFLDTDVGLSRSNGVLSFSQQAQTHEMDDHGKGSRREYESSST